MKWYFIFLPQNNKSFIKVHFYFIIGILISKCPHTELYFDFIMVFSLNTCPQPTSLKCCWGNLIKQLAYSSDAAYQSNFTTQPSQLQLTREAACAASLSQMKGGVSYCDCVLSLITAAACLLTQNYFGIIVVLANRG